MEISALRQVHGEIVDDTVQSSSLVAGQQRGELALPDGVVVSLIVQPLEAATRRSDATAALAPETLAERRPPGAAFQAKALPPLEPELGGDFRGADARAG
ncbi:MAG: hypothetical protein FJ083_09350 [Cyanobacteria bacterium K_Offshore_surface_m2_239]|nr:hypothetical protein [Cyanobacteria bacterium K_Offshore_surface_m2_239]